MFMSADGLQWTRGDVKVITASKQGGEWWIVFAQHEDEMQ